MAKAIKQDLPAGDFSSWLRHARNALLIENGTEVDCGDCIACCSSSQFIHVRPEETRTLDRIPKDLPVAAPGRPKGHVLLGYDKNGFCPMMVHGTCSIYEHRPQTCRNYDCRVFTAAGITAGDDDKARITQRVRRWKFSYPTERDYREHLAVQAAANFIREHAGCFPGGKIPSTPDQLAILAIKAYDVFLKKDGGSAKTGHASLDTEIAAAIVEACRKFDARRPAPVRRAGRPERNPAKGSQPRREGPVSAAQIRSFRKKVLTYYDKHGRDLPWRRRVTPYRVLVSEIMLQQTQVERVVEKYREFLAAFPGFEVLARARVAKLLKLWSGMGYNRRALSLQKLAQVVVSEHRGRLPSDPAELVKLPGIGPYTAGAVVAFAFNLPVTFMDTNIRRVFIHEFFKDREGVRDEELVPLVDQTLYRKDPRKWYNALMDYGTMLKQKHGNPNIRSAHYTRQGPFENSNRQVRGSILKILVSGSPLTTAQVVKKSGMDQERVKQNLVQLEKEGFIRKKGKTYFI